MQFNKYATIFFAMLAGIIGTSDHKYSITLAIIALGISVIWSGAFKVVDE